MAKAALVGDLLLGKQIRAESRPDARSFRTTYAGPTGPRDFALVLGVAATSSLYRIGNFDSLHAAPWSRYAIQFRDDPDHIRKALTKIFPDPALPASHYPGGRSSLEATQLSILA